MTIKLRCYEKNDYTRVSDFLIAQYKLNNADGNWIEPMWEYAHHHGLLDHASLEKMGYGRMMETSSLLRITSGVWARRSFNSIPHINL